MIDRRRNVVPAAVSYEQLLATLEKRLDKPKFLAQTLHGAVFEIIPGDGCPCDDCVSERNNLLEELKNKIHEEYQRRVHLCCPQRAAHDLNRQDPPQIQFTCTTVTITPPEDNDNGTTDNNNPEP